MKRSSIGFILIILLTGCDIYLPQKSFRLVIPEKDYFYNYITGHLKPVLEKNGYAIEIMHAPNAIVANQMVAQGQADLTFIDNISTPVIEALDSDAGHLRSVLPLTTRLFFAFTKTEQPNLVTAKELFENKRVGVEVLQGEAHKNLANILTRAKINHVEIVSSQDNPDVITYWGTFYGERTTRLMAEGWRPFSFKQNWLEFQALVDPALHSFTLPSLPGDSNSVRLNSLATEAILVTNQAIGENSIYELAETIFQNKSHLLRHDIMYRFIRESIDRETLIYPLHEGVNFYLQRDQPTFFERYADALALALSVIAIAYGAVQAVLNNIARKRKERIDQYFLEYLDIKAREHDIAKQIDKLDDLFHRAVKQMTNEKLDKSDFHIFSRLVQQELTILRFNP